MSADREFLVVYGEDVVGCFSEWSHLAPARWPVGRKALCGLGTWKAPRGEADRMPLCPDCQTIALGGAA